VHCACGMQHGRRYSVRSLLFIAYACMFLYVRVCSCVCMNVQGRVGGCETLFFWGGGGVAAGLCRLILPPPSQTFLFQAPSRNSLHCLLSLSCSCRLVAGQVLQQQVLTPCRIRCIPLAAPTPGTIGAQQGHTATQGHMGLCTAAGTITPP
jgi:hypothetical protein